MSTPKPIANIESLLAPDGPACLIIKARFEPIGDQDRFQPAGFPEMGHVIYDAPRSDDKGNPLSPEKVCIVDSAASMANHLETVCFENALAGILHSDLAGLPYVKCVTDRRPKVGQGEVILDPEDPKDKLVVTTLTEGHRLASDYFLDGLIKGIPFRKILREAFGIIIIQKEKKQKDDAGKKGKKAGKAKVTAFISSEDWWQIFTTIFRYDPNSLVHGLLFAQEQIKISRLLTAHLEAFGAGRVGSSGVKFDRLGKTNSGQPIFPRDEETAKRIEGTFMIDLGLLRSFGHGDLGLSKIQKRLLLEYALWKIQRMTETPFRFRSGCHLKCFSKSVTTDNPDQEVPADALKLDMVSAIDKCAFGDNPVTEVYYTAKDLFNPSKEKPEGDSTDEDEDQDDDDNSDEVV